MNCPKCGNEGKLIESDGEINTWVCGTCIGFWDEEIK
jgi:transcription elongation factor Elf1